RPKPHTTSATTSPATMVNSSRTRKESSDGKGNVQGSYGYTDAHGIYRQVDYVADAYGFRANVKTNEPGTDNQNPADVHIQANPVQYAPAPHYGGYPRY
ncbi:hypothetical protein CEXT_769811, partial [Caerostris extrusa]